MEEVIARRASHLVVLLSVQGVHGIVYQAVITIAGHQSLNLHDGPDHSAVHPSACRWVAWRMRVLHTHTAEFPADYTDDTDCIASETNVPSVGYF